MNLIDQNSTDKLVHVWMFVIGLQTTPWSGLKKVTIWTPPPSQSLFNVSCSTGRGKNQTVERCLLMCLLYILILYSYFKMIELHCSDITWYNYIIYWVTILMTQLGIQDARFAWNIPNLCAPKNLEISGCHRGREDQPAGAIGLDLAGCWAPICFLYPKKLETAGSSATLNETMFNFHVRNEIDNAICLLSISH